MFHLLSNLLRIGFLSLMIHPLSLSELAVLPPDVELTVFPVVADLHQLTVAGPKKKQKKMAKNWQKNTMAKKKGRNPLRTFLWHTSISKKCLDKMITHTFLLSFPSMTSHELQPPTLLLNINVQCVNDESFLSMYLSLSVMEKYGACAPNWRTSFNTPATTLRGQHP